MAQKVLTTYTCDLDQDGQEREAETVTFYSPSNGGQYELDLCDDHQKVFVEVVDALDDYITHARRSGGVPAPVQRRGGRTTTTRAPRTVSEIDPKAVRAWANENGIEVSPRGRISAQVIEKYKAAS